MSLSGWSRIGLGCGPLGSMHERDAVRLVHAALEMGVTVFDTAPSYGASESHLGKALAARDAVIVTKGGYGASGCADWTPECITRGIERAIAVLGHVDVFLLHSCERRDDLLEPLVTARDKGRVGAIGYSGDGDALAWAAHVGAFDVLECSVNLFDQRALAFIGAKKTLAKRAIGNAPWRGVYGERMHAMFDTPPSVETAIRFAAYSGVDCALVGTSREDHLAMLLDAVRRGPLTNAGELRERFTRCGASWDGVV